MPATRRTGQPAVEVWRPRAPISGRRRAPGPPFGRCRAGPDLWGQLCRAG